MIFVMSMTWISFQSRFPEQEYGRAKAGLAQLTRKGVQVKKERITSQGYRVQAQILCLPSSRVLWLNTYLPPDPQLIGQYDDSVLREVLAEVETILTTTTYDDVVWASDLNWDMARNTCFARTMSNFVEKTGLVSLWSEHPVQYTLMARVSQLLTIYFCLPAFSHLWKIVELLKEETTYPDTALSG